METISQALVGIRKDTKYRLNIDYISEFLGSEDSLYVLFTKETICVSDIINFPPKNEYLLLSNRFNKKLSDEVNLNQRYEWQRISFNNLDISDYNYIYIFGNKTHKGNEIEKYSRYYFLDNIILRPMSYGLVKQDLNYNFCDIGAIEIPIKIEKEIEESDTLLVKLVNSRLNFETEGKTIVFDEGTNDTIIYFSATYNDDYRFNPDYIVDIEFESTKKGDIGKENISLTINNNDLEVDVYAENYCDEDSLYIYVDITQKNFSSINEGQVYLYLPKGFVNKFKHTILENTLDPNVQITTFSQSENLESIYKINLNSTLSKSSVHGIEEDLKLRIKFSLQMDMLDSLNIIKTVTNLFVDGCEKTQYDTVYNNSMRNRIVLNDTIVCNSFDLSYLKSRNLKFIDGNDIDDLILTKSGEYIVSYETVEECVVQNTFNLKISNDFFLETNLSYKDSTDITIKIDSKFISAIDSIREFTGKEIYKIYPIREGYSGQGSTLTNLSPKVNSYQIADSLFIERDYDIINQKYDIQNNHYQNVLIYYPKADSIIIESDGEFFDGCEFRNGKTSEVIYLSDSSNRVFDYYMEDRIINLFPNPTDRVINLEYEVLFKGLYTFSIFDLLGRELYTNTKYIHRGSYKESIDISEFVSGTYSIMIVSPKETYFQKFMISK